MIKQGNIFTGLELDAIEKHTLSLERRDQLFHEMGVVVIDDRKKGKHKKIENSKFLRTKDGIYELKTIFRHYFIAINIRSKEEKWITANEIIEYDETMQALLKKEDQIQYKNGDRYSIGTITDIAEVYRYKEKKIIVRDLYDNDKYVITFDMVMSVVKLGGN